MHVHGVHMCVCIDACRFACGYVHFWWCTWMSVSVHVDTLGWCHESSSVGLYVIHCYRVFQLKLNDIDLAGWESQFVLGILNLLSDCWNNKWTTSTWHFSMFWGPEFQASCCTLSYLLRTTNNFKAIKCCLKLFHSRSVLLTCFLGLFWFVITLSLENLYLSPESIFWTKLSLFFW